MESIAALNLRMQVAHILHKLVTNLLHLNYSLDHPCQFGALQLV